MESTRAVLLIGGGVKPPEAMRLFLERAAVNGEARILVIGWASGEFIDSLSSVTQDLEAAGNTSTKILVDSSHSPPKTAREKEQLMSRIEWSTAVFFVGGNQSLLMDGLADEGIKQRFLDLYASGRIFGGTSAGTAIMSSRMIYGHESLDKVDQNLVWIRDGLGILPSSILDQHFFRRGRHNRLLGAVSQYPCHLAIGVDEDASMLVTNEQFARIIGGQVMVVNAARGDSMEIAILNCGDQYDLQNRCRIAG